MTSLSEVAVLFAKAPLIGQGETSEPAPGSGGLLDIVLSGGVFGLMIMLVLFSLSVATAYLVFDQFMTLKRSEILPDGVSETVRQSLLTGRPVEADAACRRTPSVLSLVLLSGLSEIDLGWREVEKAVEDSLAEQAARLMRRIEYLSVIGNIAPMVGLLGTVTGMILTFQQVAMTRGAAGAGDLAEGIYQALITTVGGLLIAIPALGAFAICRNRVDSLVAEVAHQSQHALLPIKRRPATRVRPPSSTLSSSTASSSASSSNPAARNPSAKSAPPSGQQPGLVVDDPKKPPRSSL